jgi:tryptophanyl-tRNA synthetase
MDGGKMSKSRANAIALAASEDETARLIRTARTDAERQITYEPDRRPEVSNLVLLAALCLERSPEDLAAEVGGAGASGLKRLLTDALNERLRPLRQRRRELADDPTYLRSVLTSGTNRARDIAAATLGDVRELMHNAY